MVVIIPKKRQCRRTCSAASVCSLMAFLVVACCTTGLKMSDLVGVSAEGLEGGRSAVFPRSISPMDYQKTLWRDGAGHPRATKIGARRIHRGNTAARVEVKGASGVAVAHRLEKRETVIAKNRKNEAPQINHISGKNIMFISSSH